MQKTAPNPTPSQYEKKEKCSGWVGRILWSQTATNILVTCPGEAISILFFHNSAFSHFLSLFESPNKNAKARNHIVPRDYEGAKDTGIG